MSTRNPNDAPKLDEQLKRQERYGWDLERDIDWARGVDINRPLLPLDDQAIAFPRTSREQRLALSQWMGLVVNSTIGEMERVIDKMRDHAWAQILRAYPVNPEMWELGQRFFDEEAKHSAAFTRYNDLFCRSAGIDPYALDQIVPKAFGSTFLSFTVANSRAGGHAFWWTVAATEEISILLYKQMAGFEDEVDPLFHEVHKRHMEEEARHQNYAFLMLEVIRKRAVSPGAYFHRKIDLLLSPFFSSVWALAELHKIFDAKRLAGEHPFFATLASCLPLLEKGNLMKRIFVSAPYLSPMLNTRFHPQTMKAADRCGAIALPFPEPQPARLVTLRSAA